MQEMLLQHGQRFYAHNAARDFIKIGKLLLISAAIIETPGYCDFAEGGCAFHSMSFQYFH